MGVRINLERAAGYINWLPVQKLEGLADALEAKCAEIGVGPGAPLAPAIGPQMTGNVRGILKFIESVNPDSTDADKIAIAKLAGTVFARIGATNFVRKVAAPEPTDADSLTPRERRAKRRAARSRRRK